MDYLAETKPAKPWYKRWWIWVIAIVIIIGGYGGNKYAEKPESAEPESQITSVETKTAEPQENDSSREEEVLAAVPKEYVSALGKARSYLRIFPFSKSRLYDQLTSEYGEQFIPEAAQYAVDNVVADWKDNALKSAKKYQDSFSMSPQAIYDQLISKYGEHFTVEEADYAINNLEK